MGAIYTQPSTEAIYTQPSTEMRKLGFETLNHEGLHQFLPLLYRLESLEAAVAYLVSSPTTATRNQTDAASMESGQTTRGAISAAEAASIGAQIRTLSRRLGDEMARVLGPAGLSSECAVVLDALLRLSEMLAPAAGGTMSIYQKTGSPSSVAQEVDVVPSRLSSFPPHPDPAASGWTDRWGNRHSDAKDTNELGAWPPEATDWPRPLYGDYRDARGALRERPSVRDEG
jgi:hypothetical protein